MIPSICIACQYNCSPRFCWCLKIISQWVGSLQSDVAAMWWSSLSSNRNCCYVLVISSSERRERQWGQNSTAVGCWERRVPGITWSVESELGVSISGSYEVVWTIMERKLDVHALDKQGWTGTSLLHLQCCIHWSNNSIWIVTPEYMLYKLNSQTHSSAL